MHPLYTYIKQRLTAASYAESEASALARWILEEVFGFSALMLYAGKDMDFPAENRKRLDDILLRLEHYEPIQYIIGEARFGGLFPPPSPRRGTKCTRKDGVLKR